MAYIGCFTRNERSMENMASNIYLEIEEGLGEIQRRNKLRGGNVFGNKKMERNFYLTEG
jgi:hypothetical protein